MNIAHSRSLRRSRRLRAIVAAALAGLCGLAPVGGCVVDRPTACRIQSDCSRGHVCSVQGFCEQECSKNEDCPCGSSCAPACGVCLRHDRSGPATCFSFRHGLDTAAMLGVCRSDDRDADAVGGSDRDSTAEDASDGDAAEAGVCSLSPVSQPLCLESPPIDASSSDEDADAAEDVDRPLVDADVEDAGEAADGASALEDAGGDT